MNTAKAQVSTEKPTVNKIIEAAIPLFATKGLAAVSVKELADAAGVNIALISYYFGGKENLYAFVLEKQLAILESMIDSISKEDISPIMKIRQFAAMLIVTHKENPYIDRLFFVEIFNPTKYFDSTVKIAAHRLHAFLQDCIKDAISKVRSDIKPDFAAISLMKILHLSFAPQHVCGNLLPNKEDNAEQYAAQALEIYLYGVTN
ncbi:Transcriptional regulator, TetR family [uncultured Sporomusa sp.]|uniref:Transcriptional regulator, TetR family n=1 Tax=uncultured Sporomusa sp. TaxID=307249 RepID=A0A212LTD1_9FIRM|nr:TetR family transcriptional regulator [uncultured Sporomusa sp.]SCM80854.1 Transcriptional regulator, TetR family [uncultured Sporomusa sp.]